MVREPLGGFAEKISVMAYICLHNLHDKVKVKQTHYTPCRRRGERRYSLYSFTTSEVDGVVSGQRPAPAPVKGPPVPIGKETGWAPELVWIHRMEEKSFYFRQGSNLDLPVVQFVVIHYTV
jgi:hypothetical protein